MDRYRHHPRLRILDGQDADYWARWGQRGTPRTTEPKNAWAMRAYALLIGLGLLGVGLLACEGIVRLMEKWGSR